MLHAQVSWKTDRLLLAMVLDILHVRTPAAPFLSYTHLFAPFLIIQRFGHCPELTNVVSFLRGVFHHIKLINSAVGGLLVCLLWNLNHLINKLVNVFHNKLGGERICCSMIFRNILRQGRKRCNHMEDSIACKFCLKFGHTFMLVTLQDRSYSGISITQSVVCSIAGRLEKL